MIKKVPAREEIVCDRCGATGERFAQGPFYGQGIHGRYEDWGRGICGGIGGTTARLDLCQNCVSDFKTFMREKQ
jgi:hypothetical protein